MEKYTPQKISKRILYDKAIIEEVLKWKEKFFTQGLASADKIEAMYALHKIFCSHYQRDPIKLVFTDTPITNCYDTKEHKIRISISNPSILTYLHEYGHHLFGNKEYLARHWSVWLFRHCFPHAFKVLQHRGNKLVL